MPFADKHAARGDQRFAERHCERSEASISPDTKLDCFVAALLAMTRSRNVYLTLTTEFVRQIAEIGDHVVPVAVGLEVAVLVRAVFGHAWHESCLQTE